MAGTRPHPERERPAVPDHPRRRTDLVQAVRRSARALRLAGRTERHRFRRAGTRLGPSAAPRWRRSSTAPFGFVGVFMDHSGWCRKITAVLMAPSRFTGAEHKRAERTHA